MNDKPVAGLITLAAIVPLCAVCVLGPVEVGAVAAWFAGWPEQLRTRTAMVPSFTRR